MRSRSVLLASCVAVCFAGSGAVWAQPAPAGGASGATAQGNAAGLQGPMAASPNDVEVSQIRAKIVRINRSKRTLTLRGPEGNHVTVIAGPEVRNFASIKQGDEVILRFTQAMAVVISKPGSKLPDASVADARVQDPQRGLPAGAVGRQVSLTGLIVGVDPNTHVLSVVDQHGGAVHNFLVRAPERQAEMRSLRVGDLITVVFTEAVAVAVEPAKAH